MSLAIIEEHALLASFYTDQRELAVRLAHHDLRSLGEADELLEAQLDGLRLAGDRGFDRALALADPEEPASLFAPLALAVDGEHPRRIARALDAWNGDPSAIEPMALALAWGDRDRAAKSLSVLLQSTEPLLHRLGLRAHARMMTNPALPWQDALGHADEGVRLAAVKLVETLCDAASLPMLLVLAGGPPSPISRGALRAAAVLGDAGSRASFGDRAAADPDLLTSSWDVAGVFGGPHSAAGRLTTREEVFRAGASGAVHHIEPLLDAASDDTLARAAGEALAWITGIAIEGPELRRRAPDAPDDDGPVAVDGGLPMPRFEGVRAWIASRKGLATATRPLFLGAPAGDDARLTHALKGGTQLRRRLASLRRAIGGAPGPHCDVEAPTRHQRALVG